MRFFLLEVSITSELFLPEDFVKTYIRVLSGEALGKKVLLDQPVVNCGRHYENDLKLKDNNVSRLHCRFVLVSGSAYLVEDAGSSNGTYVNGVLTRYKVLEEGDLIRIGNTLLEVASADQGSVVEDDAADAIEEFDFEAELTCSLGTARQVLDSLAESYPETSGEPTFVESKADRDIAYQASLIASKNLTLESLCKNLVTLVGDWAQVDQAMLVLLDENEHDFSQTFTPQVPKNGLESAHLPKVKFSRELVDRVLASRLPSMSVFDASAEQAQKVTAMCVPIDNGHKLRGLIYVDDFQGGGEPSRKVFTNQDLEFFGSIGKQAAAAIENNVYFRTAMSEARQEAVGKLNSVVSHRINNMLHLIGGGEFLIEAGLKSNDLPQIAKGWDAVKRTQNRISQLSTNMALHCRNFQPLMRALKPRGVIDLVVNDLDSDLGESRFKVVHRTASDLSLNLDAHYFDRAVRNILAVGLSAVEAGDNGQEVVAIETLLPGDCFLIRVSFRHFDDRFNLAELGTGEINTVSAEHGFLEMLVSRKIVESQGGSLACSLEPENLNRIEIQFPMVSN